MASTFKRKTFFLNTVAKLWFPNTRHALELLSEDRLGSPSHIIIHTGTNDLRAQQERVATALKGVIEKAYSTFPNASCCHEKTFTLSPPYSG